MISSGWNSSTRRWGISLTSEAGISILSPASIYRAEYTTIRLKGQRGGGAVGPASLVSIGLCLPAVTGLPALVRRPGRDA